MKRTKLIVTCLLLAMTTALFGQTITVKGTVSDAFGDPVTGAYVVVTGTTNGTSTGVDGDFVLSNGGVEFAEKKLEDYVSEAVHALDIFPDCTEKEILAGVAHLNSVRTK